MPRLLALLTLALVNLSQPAFGMRVQAAAQNGLEERLTNALRKPGTGLEETPTVDWHTVARLVGAIEWYLRGDLELCRTLHGQVEAGISEQGVLDDVRQALEDEDPRWLRTELGEVLTAVRAKVQKGYAGFLVYQIEQISKALPVGAQSLLPDLGQTTPPDQVARNVQVWAALLPTLSAMPEWRAPLDPLDLQRNTKFLDAQKAGFDIPHLHYLLKSLNGIPDHDLVVVAGFIFGELAQHPDVGQDPQRFIETVQKRSHQVSDATFAHPAPLASPQPLDALVVETLITRAKRLVGWPAAGLEEDESLSYNQVLALLEQQHPSFITLNRPVLEDTQPIAVELDVRGLDRPQAISAFQAAAREFLGTHGPDHLGTWRYDAEILGGHATITARSRAGLEELGLTAVLEPPATGVERPELGGIVIGEDGRVIVPVPPQRPVSLGTEVWQWTPEQAERFQTALRSLEQLRAAASSANVAEPSGYYVLAGDGVAAAPALQQLGMARFVVVVESFAQARAVLSLGVYPDQLIGVTSPEVSADVYRTLGVTRTTWAGLIQLGDRGIQEAVRPWLGGDFAGPLIVVQTREAVQWLLEQLGALGLPTESLEEFGAAVQAAAEYLQAML